MIPHRLVRLSGPRHMRPDEPRQVRKEATVLGVHGDVGRRRAGPDGGDPTFQRKVINESSWKEVLFFWVSSEVAGRYEANIGL